MNKLSFGFFLKNLQIIYKKKPNQQVLIDTLFDEIMLYSPSDFTEPSCIAKARASCLFNGTESVPKKIIAASYNDEYEENVYQFFGELTQNNIDSVKLKSFIEIIIEEMSSDDVIPNEIRNKIHDLYANNNYSAVIAEVFLYTLRYDSENIDTKYVKPTKKKSIKNKPYNSEIDVSTENKDMNIPYIHALYEVYGEKEHKSVSSIEMCPKYKNHFSRQQKAYFDAEAVQRSSRDSYKSEEPFDELKDEMYDGIIEAYDSDYCCGYDRLQGVLNQASQVQFDVSVLCHETEWISQSVKKGICHHLVNDDKIKSWVITHE